MAKGNKWTSFSGQMAKIADQGRAEREASKAHEAMTSQPDKATYEKAVAEPVQVVESNSTESEPVVASEPKSASVTIAAPMPATEPVTPALRDGTPVAYKPKAAAKPISRSPAKVEPAPVVEAEKVKKKSTSLYLSGAASRALHTIAAQQGVRPHRVIDDALRAEFKRHGLDFDTLNAAD